METQTVYAHVPRPIKEGLEDLATQNRRRKEGGPSTLSALITRACDQLLRTELTGYISPLDAQPLASEETVELSQLEEPQMKGNNTTHAEEILRAVAALVKQQGTSAMFTRADVRRRAGVPTDRWALSYNPIFQGMRVDQPGGAPQSRYPGIFRRVKHGEYVLTPAGQELIASLS